MQDFYTIVLGELVLEVAMHRNEALVEPVENNNNKALRHASYRQYVMWLELGTEK